MDIHSLTYFKKVADLQHLTRAAVELRVAQPSLSRTIAALEDELGVRLFDRVGRNITLNSNGEIVLRHTNRILDEINDIHSELNDASDSADRTVTVSVKASSKLIPEIITLFRHEHPNIRISLIQETSDFSSPKDCELCIYSSTLPSNESNSNNNNVMDMLEESLIVAMPKFSPLANLDSIDIRDLDNEDFICLPKGKCLRTTTDTYCNLAGFEPNVVLESDNPALVRDFICAGLGVAMIPSITWANMESPLVTTRPISYPDCKRYLHISWKENGYISAAALLFRDFVANYFAALKAEQQ